MLRDYDIPSQATNTAYLQYNNWNDFGYQTLFNLTVFDENGTRFDIGNIKLGFVGQDDETTVVEHISEEFENLSDDFFSLGQDADFYQNMVEDLSEEMVTNLLTTLGDVVHDDSRLECAKNEPVFNISLLRTVNHISISEQFKRILGKEALLTDYHFFYKKEPNEVYSGIEVEFKVKPNSKPSSNIHILIGRNGVGKTTLLNNMVDALLPERGEEEETGRFTKERTSGFIGRVGFNNYFAGVVSVSFSAFDPFIPPDDQSDNSVGMRYYYVGLKKRIVQQTQQQDKIAWGLKDKNDLCNDFTSSLEVCFALGSKRERWVKAIKKLESDANFAAMDLCQLVGIYLENERDSFDKATKSLFSRMSSGHAIVLLTITKLVETVEEKTLLLLDEPESHLHPPLLSAFTRALSDLLVNRNAVAIIATHSPVVLQEVPKSCVSILRRTGLVTKVDRPENETFAENVGVLTREIFGLEVSKSGFHNLLEASVEEGRSYEDIMAEYENQLGFEGKIILRSMIVTRDSQVEATR